MWENIHKMVGSDSVISMINPTTGHGLEEQEHPAGKVSFFGSEVPRFSMWDPFFSRVSARTQKRWSVRCWRWKSRTAPPDNLGAPGEWLVDALLFHSFWTEHIRYIIWNSKATFVLRYPWYPNLAVTCRDNLMQNKQVWWMLGAAWGCSSSSNRHHGLHHRVAHLWRWSPHGEKTWSVFPSHLHHPSKIPIRLELYTIFIMIHHDSSFDSSFDFSFDSYLIYHSIFHLIHHLIYHLIHHLIYDLIHYFIYHLIYHVVHHLIYDLIHYFIYHLIHHLTHHLIYHLIHLSFDLSFGASCGSSTFDIWSFSHEHL